ncbi:uncharacterized protein SPPG_07644 [Spizellomyces punctatus DAOM BR117]|uniref:EF-hand domain-containing protein n=1 Tax=Spizellomyces punctatus (strain DAOM BR117) TaxID=645134 RepID=A0A0L0H8G6_SPIPD|nr:uncharacterized protein SPPG_07644 [Spizellomyces punctatus DAOM BR117]KNC97256.1 hypothetical protein SPPG_07644 [Spizellomyces punctatus DAOM BR117]|eukprot:XP_016605296.1 hypothetical protein SPPG_07644 [Spizellomyces punctatus DAOM BR117]
MNSTPRLVLLLLLGLFSSGAILQSTAQQPVYDLSDHLVNHLANRAITRHRHKSGRDNYLRVLQAYDGNGDGSLDREEILAMINSIDKSVGKKADNEEVPKFVHIKRAVGLHDFADEDLVEQIMVHVGNTGTLRHETLSSMAADAKLRDENNDVYGATCDLIDRKVQELGPSSCDLELRAALSICMKHASILSSLECLSTAKAQDLCSCFDTSQFTKRDFMPIEMSTVIAAHTHELIARADSFEMTNWPYELLDGPSRSRLTPARMPKLQRIGLAVLKAVIRGGARIVFTALRIGGVVLGPVGIPIAAVEIFEFCVLSPAIFMFTVILIDSRGFDRASQYHFNGAAYQLFFLRHHFRFVLTLAGTVTWFVEDFRHPIETLRSTGDLLPVDFVVWSTDQPAPKCSLLLYWSDSCGFQSTGASHTCSHDGRRVHGNSCVDIGRDGSCGCGDFPLLWCSSLCWKVTEGCCCEALKFRDPVPGSLAAASSFEEPLGSVSDCAKLCVHSPGCSAFSVMPNEDDANKAVCRISTTDSVAIERNDAATTFYSKGASDEFAGGVTFRDIVQTLKVMYNSDTCDTGGRWDAAIKQVGLALMVMGNCLRRVVDVFPQLINSMISDYTNVGDFDTAVVKLRKYLAAGLTAQREVVRGCAYLDNPEGLAAFAAMNIYTASRGINMVPVAEDLLGRATATGLNPSNGYWNGNPSTGVNEQNQILTTRGRRSRSDFEDDDPVDPDNPDDPPEDGPDPPEDPGEDDPDKDYEDADKDPNGEPFLKRFRGLLCVRVTVTVTRRPVPQEVEWINLYVVNDGQADSMVQEHVRYECQNLMQNGVPVVWSSTNVKAYPNACTLKERRRIWVDGGKTHTRSTEVFKQQLGPIVIDGTEKDYYFDEIMVTHNDEDHFASFLKVLRSGGDNLGPRGRWVPLQAPMTWNNPMDISTRTIVSATEHNDYTKAVNFLAHSVVPLIGPKAKTFRLPDTKKKWRDIITAAGLTPPNEPWVDSMALVNPDSAGKQGHAFTSILFELWQRSSDNGLQVSPGYVGGRPPGQSFRLAVSGSTDVLWPPTRQLTDIYGRRSFGGTRPDRVTTQEPLVTRSFSSYVADEQCMPAENAPLGIAPVCSSSPFVALDERELPDSKLDVAPLKNYISIVTQPHLGAVKLLLTGDVIAQSFARFTTGRDSHLVKVAHHGSKNTGSRADVSGFTNADVFVITGKWRGGRVDGDHPYAVKFILWIIQEHFKVRADNTLRIYVLDAPSDSNIPNTAFRRFKDPTFRPADCNFEIWRTNSKKAGFFKFSTKSTADDSGSPIDKVVDGAVLMDFGSKPAKGNCNLSWDSTDNF